MAAKESAWQNKEKNLRRYGKKIARGVCFL